MKTEQLLEGMPDLPKKTSVVNVYCQRRRSTSKKGQFWICCVVNIYLLLTRCWHSESQPGFYDFDILEMNKLTTSNYQNIQSGLSLK